MHLSMYMHTPPITCELNATLAEVARMMEFDEVGSVVVMTEDNRIAGIVTDRDLVVRGVAHEGGPLSRVETIMSAPVITVHETQDPFDAAAKMARANCRRLPVVSATGRLQGVVSLDDIMPLFTSSAERLARGAGQPKETTVLG
jgi:signal-transduction protein with cAMP-binding, CBS, and nucleotidyltransferase domain